jgi:hypothetical protein
VRVERKWRRKDSSEDSSSESENEDQDESDDEDEDGMEHENDEDTESASEESGDEDKIDGDEEEKSCSDDEDDLEDAMAIALAVADGREVSSEEIQPMHQAAEESENKKQKLYVKYILCAHAAQHCGFIEPDYFGNLAELLSTHNVTIRRCIMWAFASVLPCKNVLSPLLIRLLYKSLKDETLGWSISYLFRKISEYNEYVPMVRWSMWIGMLKLLVDRNLSQQVRTNLVYALTNVYNKMRRWVAPVIKARFEHLIFIDGIGNHVLVATIHSLHSMALAGADFKDIHAKLKDSSTSGDAAAIEVIREFLDFLDNKRILSSASGHAGSNVKKELTATQNTTVSRSEEEAVEPTVKLQSMDHLLSTVGHLGRTFNAESKPNDVREGNNQSWYRTTWYEVSNLAALAKTGELQDQDFDYLVGKFCQGVHWSVKILNTEVEIFEMIAGAFRDAAEKKQAIPRNALDAMISRLSGASNTIHRKCAEGLLHAVKNRQSLTDEQMNNIEDKLKTVNDILVKQYLIELLALYVSKGHRFKLNLEAIENDLTNQETCETTSYLFFKAAAVEKRTFSSSIMETLSRVAGSSKFSSKARDHCLWALAYSIKETKDKTSISDSVIAALGDLLADPEKSVKQTAAVALCYYASDENTVLAVDVLDQLAGMLSETDYGLLNNVLSVYLRLSKQNQTVSNVVLKKLCPLLYHEDFSIREKAIWIIKHLVDHEQPVEPKAIDQTDNCLNDKELAIRIPAALIFINYWMKHLKGNDRKILRVLSIRIENFLTTIFRQAFNLEVQRSALELLRLLVKKQFVLSETVIHLIECCLYDRETSISSPAIEILQIYSAKEQSLPQTTLVCLEHLLTTETPNIDKVISILKKRVASGHLLSKKAIEVLTQLLFKTGEPKDITILLTHADRNQPLPKSVDELLRQIYYGQVLEYSQQLGSLNKATKKLRDSTSQGKLLCTSVLDLIVRQLKSADRQSLLMPILVNVVSNGQSLHKERHRPILEEIFSETVDAPSPDLIEIFTYLTRQNQIISDEIIVQLENFLDDSSYNHFVIEIYQYLVERQKSLASSIIQKALHFFNPKQWNDLSDHLQLRLALFYKSLADNRPKEAVQTFLPSLLTADQPTAVRKEICTAVRLLAHHREQLQPKTVDALIILIDHDDDADLQQMALEILKCIRSTDAKSESKVSKVLDLLQCNDQTDDRALIKQLKDVTGTSVALPATLVNRLLHMIYSCDLELKKDAATILVMSTSEGKTLSPQVLDVVFMTLLDATINAHTLPLLLSHASEQVLPSSVIDDLLTLANRSSNELVQHCAREILAKQMKNNQTKIGLFFDYLKDKADLDRPKDLRHTLKFVRAMIILENRISADLLSSLLDHFSGEHQDEIIDILLFANEHNVKFHQDQRLIRSIASALQTHPTSKLVQLIQILVEHAVVIDKETLQFLFNKLVHDDELDALICLEHAAERQPFDQRMLEYFIESISDPSKEEWTAQTFAILRQQISHGYVKNPSEIIKSIQLPSIIDMNKLQQLQSLEHRLDTIQNLLFVEYLQPDVFDQPVEQWSRNCLCIDMIASCTDATNDRVISFFQHLTQFEQINGYQLLDPRRDAFLRKLIEKQRAISLTLSTINDVLIYATTSTDTTTKILHSNQLDWLAKMRSGYIENLLSARFHQQRYEKSLVDHLVQRISNAEQLTAVLIDFSLRAIQSANEAMTFLDFCTTYTLTSDDLMDVFFQDRTPTDFDTLNKKLQVLVAGKILKSHWIGSNKNFARARHAVQTLIQRGWTVSKLLTILTAKEKIEQSADASESITYLIDVLKVLIDYNVDSNITGPWQSFFAETKISLWPSLAYNRVIEHSFGSSSSEKNLQTLLSELTQLNSKIDSKALSTKFQAVEAAYKGKSTALPKETSIESWSKSTIGKWAQLVRESNNAKRPILFEMLAVMKRAVYLDSNFEPRPIQILAVLIMFDTNDQGGRLLQILTGEGKSTVVSMLAVIKALNNLHVDIITSSMTLARRDAHERKSFYDYFDITVSHNNDETSYSSGPKECYKADVVYGNSSQFQFDLLRHEFSLSNTR